MKYYAIKRKKDGKFISGTDFRYNPPRSIFANEFKPPLLIAEYNISSTLLYRHINRKYYDIVSVEVKEIGRNYFYNS